MNGGTAITGSIVVRFVKRFDPVRNAYNYRIVATYSDPLAICPEPTPLSSIPCQQPGAALGIGGRYVPGKSHLEPVTGAGAIFPAEPTCTSTGCTGELDISSAELFGRIVLVMYLSVGDITKVGTNDLGGAGFAIPVVLNIPRYKPKA